MSALLKIAVSMGSSLVTEKFIAKVALLLLERLVASTANKLDDDLVKAVKEALGVSGAS